MPKMRMGTLRDLYIGFQQATQGPIKRLPAPAPGQLPRTCTCQITLRATVLPTTPLTSFEHANVKRVCTSALYNTRHRGQSRGHHCQGGHVDAKPLQSETQNSEVRPAASTRRPAAARKQGKVRTRKQASPVVLRAKRFSRPLTDKISNSRKCRHAGRKNSHPIQSGDRGRGKGGCVPGRSAARNNSRAGRGTAGACACVARPHVLLGATLRPGRLCSSSRCAGSNESRRACSARHIKSDTSHLCLSPRDRTPRKQLRWTGQCTLLQRAYGTYDSVHARSHGHNVPGKACLVSGPVGVWPARHVKRPRVRSCAVARATEAHKRPTSAAAAATLATD